MAIIQVVANGPYQLTEGEFEIRDRNGKTVPQRGGSIYLCRCGASDNEPFCDGAHKRVGFKDSERSSAEVQIWKR